MKATTSTGITSITFNPALAGQPVTVAFLVTPQPGDMLTPSGTVTVNASTGESCTGNAPSGSCAITFSTAVDRTATATYNGDSNLSTSKLIVEMATQNPTWGEERIDDELLLKIGIQISPRTVGCYMPKAPQRPADPKQRWITFVRNHAKAIIASDFFVVVTATFQLVYVFVVVEVATRRVLHFNVTRHPTADWTLQQFRECIAGDEGYRFVIHDRDRIYSRDLDAGLKTLGLTVLKTPHKAPKANAICERWIGSARRECLDLMIPINETHIRRTLKCWVKHYNRARPHSSLGPGTPDPSSPKAELQAQRHCIPKDCRVAVTPILGGLHHEYRLEKIAA